MLKGVEISRHKSAHHIDVWVDQEYHGEPAQMGMGDTTADCQGPLTAETYSCYFLGPAALTISLLTYI